MSSTVDGPLAPLLSELKRHRKLVMQLTKDLLEAPPEADLLLPFQLGRLGKPQYGIALATVWDALLEYACGPYETLATTVAVHLWGAPDTAKLWSVFRGFTGSPIQNHVHRVRDRAGDRVRVSEAAGDAIVHLEAQQNEAWSQSAFEALGKLGKIRPRHTQHKRTPRPPVTDTRQVLRKGPEGG